MSTLFDSAIHAALTQNWQKAIAANQSLLKENGQDVNSMNRLAHAYVQIGKLEEAKKLYKKILSIDKYNTIAIKNLEKLNAIPKSNKIPRQKSASIVLPSQFIEEPGKTKTINLVNIAPAGILSHLTPGEEVFFHPKKHSIDVRNGNKLYLGALPDDFVFKLLRFLKAGYEYKVYIKSTTKNTICVFIRETKRVKRFKSQPSFLPSSPNQIKTSIVRDQKNKDDFEDEETQSNGQEDEEV